MKKIELSNISFAYKSGSQIFNDFNLVLEQSKSESRVTAIMGHSGSGKSTLMKLLLNVETPQSGTIQIQPTNAVMAYVPQEPVLFEHLSVTDNARYFSFAGAYRKCFDEDLYAELVISLGLHDVIKSSRSVLELSGGQKQRLSLLRALSIRPHFLLLDEPCNGLDAEVKRAFLTKLREIAIQQQLSVLYITHHKLEAQLIADYIVYLAADRSTGIIKTPVIGSIQEFLQVPPVLEAALVFRFPEAKILPISRTKDGVVIISNLINATEFWLIENHNMSFVDEGGWQFIVVSLSPVFGAIRHEASGTEWLVPRDMLKDKNLHEPIRLSFVGKHGIYDKNGLQKIV